MEMCETALPSVTIAARTSSSRRARAFRAPVHGSASHRAELCGMQARHVDVDVPIRCVVQGRPPFNTVMAEPSAFMRVSIVRVGRARPTRSRHGAVSRAEASKHIDLSAAEPTLVASACRDSPPTKGQSPWVLWQRVRCRSALGNGPASRGVTRRVLAGVGAVEHTCSMKSDVVRSKFRFQRLER